MTGNIGSFRYNTFMIPMLFLLMLPLSAFASPAEEREQRDIAILERAQDLLGVRANALANQLDSFFATDRADDEFGRSRIRVRSRYEVRERAKGDDDVDYRINLRLPHLEDKFRYSFKDDQKEDQDKEESDAMKKAKKEAAKHRILKEWIFNADAGINISIPPKIVTRARARRNFVTGTLIHRFAEELTYITDESGLREETSLNSDHQINKDMLFRFVNVKTWQVLKKEFTTSHGPTILHRASDNDAFSYSFIMSSVINDGVWYVNNFRLSTTYRRNLYKNWVYLDLTPGLDFPKTWSFRRTPFIFGQLEFLFGG